MKKYLFLFVAVIVTMGFAGCENAPPGFKRDPVTGELHNLSEPPEYILTFHPVIAYPRAEDDELLLPPANPADTTPVWVKIKPEFHSSVVMEVIPLATNDPNYYNLRLKLSEDGEIWWDKMVSDNYQQSMAIALDGRYLGSFVASDPASTDDEAIEKTTGGSIVHRRVAEQEAARAAATPKPKYRAPDAVVMDRPGWVIVPGPFHEALVKEIKRHSRRNYYYYQNEAKERAKEAIRKQKEAEDDPEENFLNFLRDNGANFFGD